MLKRRFPSLGLSLFSRLVGRLRGLEVICEGTGQSYILGDYNLLKSKYFLEVTVKVTELTVKRLVSSLYMANYNLLKNKNF